MEGRAIGWVRKTLESPEAAPAEGSVQTFIDQGVECEGTLRLKVSARIDGEFRGAIETEANLIVGEAAGVQANLRAREVVISGAVVGNVVASRAVILRETGRLHGDVETPCLVVERGAFFNGSTSMVRPQAALYAEEKTSAPPKPAAKATAKAANAPSPSSEVPPPTA